MKPCNDVIYVFILFNYYLCPSSHLFLATKSWQRISERKGKGGETEGKRRDEKGGKGGKERERLTLLTIGKKINLLDAEYWKKEILWWYEEV